MPDEIVKCPKCKEIMSRNGRVRIGKKIKQRWTCKRLSGCGYTMTVEIKEEV